MTSRLIPPDSALEKHIVSQIAMGHPKAAIAREVGMNPATVYRFAKDQQLLIQQEMGRILDILPTATSTYKDLVEDYNNKDTRIEMSKTDKNHGFTATTKILESTGLLGHAQPSVMIQQNIMNINENKRVPSVISKLIEFQKQNMNTVMTMNETDQESACHNITHMEDVIDVEQ